MDNRLSALLFCGIIVTAGLLSGCKKPEPVVLSLYCSETFWEVMKEETRVFYGIYGIRIETIPIHPGKTEEERPEPKESTRHTPVPWRNRPAVVSGIPKKTSELAPDVENLIQSIPQRGFADIYLSDSVYEQKYVRNSMLVTHEYPMCLLKMGILVPKGNPFGIQSLRDAVTNRLRLGITDSSKDGMGAAAQKLLSKIPAPVAVMEEIQHRIQTFDYQDDLLNALEEKQIDAAVVWQTIDIKSFLVKKHYKEYRKRFDVPIQKTLRRDDVEQMQKIGLELYSTLLREKQFTDFIPLQDEESLVLEVPLLSLSTTLHDGQTRRFADFLISPVGQEILKKYGFTPIR